LQKWIKPIDKVITLESTIKLVVVQREIKNALIWESNSILSSFSALYPYVYYNFSLMLVFGSALR
jgi:hypothetical protein